MAFITVPAGDVDAKSPIDDTLMQLIKDDLDDLNTRVVAAAAATFALEYIGKLSYATEIRRSICYGILNADMSPATCRFMLKKSGTSGSLAFDIRKLAMPKTPITGIDHQYTAATQSIAQTGTALNTQSIARATTQISTQSITHAKAAKNTQSIISLGYLDDLASANCWLYNLDSTVDSDTLVGDGIVFAGHTNAANDGTFTIIDKNRGGGNNVVVSNASGVAQTGVAGTAQIKIMSYNYTNPVSSAFTVGRAHSFAAHTTGANNGTLTIYAINQAGNNAWVKNNTGATQAGVAGTLDTFTWQFNLSVAASTTDYIVGEGAKTATHTTGGNNAASLPIIAVNSGGNNLWLYNTAGAVQAGVAGTINTNRWTYAMPTDPSTQVVAGYSMIFSGHTNALNDGTFTIKEVNRAAANNLIIYNEAGVAQGGVAGNVYTARKLVKFSSDQSAVYTTLSFIEMQHCSNSIYNYYESRAPYQVLQVNRGGGSNYNVVIEVSSSLSQASPAGYVVNEMKSIFNTAPTLASSVTGQDPDMNIKGVSTDLIAQTITAQTPLLLYLTSVPSGDPRSLTVTLR